MAFLENCREMYDLLRHSRSDRIRSLIWCGIPLLATCKDPHYYLSKTRTRIPAQESRHGFISHHLPGTFQGALEPRAAKWFLPGLDSSPFPCVHSHLVTKMESEFSAIRDEYKRISRELANHPDSEEVMRTGDWTAMILFGPQGQNKSMETTPLDTCASFVAHEEFCAPFGFCMFSKMGPATALIPHVGSTNMRIRCHLGINVPSDSTKCFLQVGNEMRHWRNGQVLIFDDSYRHLAENNTPFTRVILNVDIWHPEITAEEKKILSSDVFSRFASIKAIQGF